MQLFDGPIAENRCCRKLASRSRMAGAPYGYGGRMSEQPSDPTIPDPVMPPRPGQDEPSDPSPPPGGLPDPTDPEAPGPTLAPG
jgi:hypothetical protein